jgi:ethanolamine utilization protein EutQ
VGKLITANDLRAMAADAKQVAVPAGSVLAPSALDLAKELGIALLWEESAPKGSGKKPPCPAAAEMTPAVAGQDAKCACGELAPGDVQTIVRQVLAQVMKPACANPKVTHVKGDGVVLEPFEGAPSGQNIKLKDVVTAREANLAAGFMTFEAAQLPWQLTYDEVDYVVEGTFTLQAGGKTYTCGPGDVLYIPKDTRVVFGSPGRAKVFYVTYPANWAEQTS